jgi:hypothetical protein
MSCQNTIIKTENILYLKFSGASKVFWLFPPKPYSPPLNMTGFTGVINVYDMPNGTLLTNSGSVAFGIDTATITETSDEGIVTEYVVPSSATITVTLTPLQVASFDNPYYELFIISGASATPIAIGYLVDGSGGGQCC